MGQPETWRDSYGDDAHRTKRDADIKRREGLNEKVQEIAKGRDARGTRKIESISDAGKLDD